MPNEVEIKLRIAAADQQTLQQHPAIQRYLVGEPTTRALISIYYDTPELTLLDSGLSLRVRSWCGGWFQAVKSAGRSIAGLHQRLEWEDLLTRNEPDFDKIVDPHLANIFGNPELRRALRPVFVVDVMRTDWHLHYPDGSEIELSLDVGELKVCQPRVWERIEPINELEIELKQGNTVHLFDLALALQQDIPFTIENISKAQRGYACMRPMPTIKTHSQANKIPGRYHTPRMLAMDSIAQMQANQEILQKVNHTASVSQLRFAVFRLAGVLEAAGDQWLVDELDWLDSFLVTPCDESHYHSLQQAFASQRYQRLQLSLGAWLQRQH